jgi:steroid 5-alpha reductase family enzyme
MKIKHSINLSKATTPLFIVSLMFFYDNFSLAAWVYLALHGTYCLLWLLKDRIYPDKQWEQDVPLPSAISIFAVVCLYWVAPYLLVSRGVELASPVIAVAIALNLLGVFLHYSSDAQKYFTLKYQPGLITEGFFARCRNTNYLGEILIYFSLALLAQHWLPFAILAGFIAFIFIPNMLKKDRSLSRYPEFEQYKQQSGLILPKLSKSTIPSPETVDVP